VPARKRAVIVTDQIPGYQIGFERSGHGYYTGTFVTFLQRQGYDVTFVLIHPSVSFLRIRRDRFSFEIRSNRLGSSTTSLYPSSAVGLIKAIAWKVFAAMPRAAQALVSATRSALRRKQGYAHVLGRFPSADDRIFVSESICRVDPEIVLYDGLFNFCEISGRADRWLIAHDVKHERANSFAARGFSVLPAGFDDRTERDILNSCGNVIAIQWDEARTFERLAPQTRVVTVPVAVSAPTTRAPRSLGSPGQCLFVGSGTFHNVDGLRWFLAECWPKILAADSQAHLRIVGSAGSTLSDVPERVSIAGIVDDISDAYRTARVVVVPLRVGSGLKVKLVEALAHGVPIVTTDVGAQGLASFSPAPFVVANDARAFANAVVELLSDDGACRTLSTHASTVAESFSPDAAFREFEAALADRSSDVMPLSAPYPLGRICLAVPTFRRLHLLPALVDDLLQQRSDVAPRECTILIIDNDPGSSARTLIETGYATQRQHLLYENVQAPGLSEVRNFALAFTGRGSYDALVMIDDDERPSPGWLAELVRVAERNAADVVNGPVTPVFAEPPPNWIRAGRFFDEDDIEDLAPLDDASSNNFLLKVAAIERYALSFDPALNLAGGEDQLFFRQLFHRGGRIVRAAHANVMEMIPSDRTTLNYLLKRYLRKGNTLAYCDRKIHGSRRATFLRSVKAFASIFRATLSFLPMTLVRGRAGAVGCLCEAARGTGMLLGLAGTQILEYRRTRKKP
jgi:glycosyltransferase involved in cell wall biosynthesis